MPFFVEKFYEFKIFTSDEVGGNEANATAILTGLKGKKSNEFQLKGAFQTAFHVNLEDVGEPLEGLCIIHDNSKPWRHLEHVEVRPMDSHLPSVSF